MVTSLHSCIMFLIGGVVCGVISYVVSDYSDQHDTERKRLEYALISAFGTVSLCYFAAKYFPDRFVPDDSPYVAVLIGLLGIGRILNYLVKRWGLSNDSKQ